MGKKVKVVFDTNVWISIFMQKKLKEEFSKIKDNITVYVSQDIAFEVSKVLQYPRISKILKKTGIREKNILYILKINSKRVEPKVKLHIINDDAEDNRILECALTAKADIIVSGDKHLLDLNKFRKTRILTPKQFFESLT